MSTLRDIAIIGIILYIVFVVMRPDGGPSEGEDAPAIEAQLLSGDSFRLSDHQGKVVVLDFWSTTCGPCRRSLPALQRVYEKTKDGGEVSIVSVSLDKGRTAESAVRRYMEGNGLSFPVIMDYESQFAQLYQVESIPTMVVIDSGGKVSHTAVGLYTTNQERLVQHIEQLIAQAK